jgi:hypothetical protein
MKVRDCNREIFVVEMGIEQARRSHRITMLTPQIEKGDSISKLPFWIGQRVYLPSRDVVFLWCQDSAQINDHGGCDGELF